MAWPAAITISLMIASSTPKAIWSPRMAWPATLQMIEDQGRLPVEGRDGRHLKMSPRPKTPRQGARRSSPAGPGELALARAQIDNGAVSQQNEQKKAKEAFILKAFKQQFDAKAEWDIVDGESPDFIVNGSVGVELCECFFTATQLLEAERARATAEIERAYLERSGPMVEVKLHWNEVVNVTKKSRQGVVRDVVEVLLEAAAKIPENTHRMLDSMKSECPEQLNSLMIIKNDALTRTNVSWSRAMYELKPPSQDLQTKIDQKLKLLPQYRALKEQWLLFHLAGDQQSSSVELSDEALEHQYKLGFDRVFVFRLWGPCVWELKGQTDRSLARLEEQ